MKSWEKVKDVAADCSHFLFLKTSNKGGVLKMGMTCPIGGCHSTGMCMHKKMMLGAMIVVVIIIAVMLLR